MTTSLDLARQLAGDLVALRRDLHRIPEIGLHLPLTQQRVLAELEGLDLEVTTGRGLSSVVAVLRGGAGTPGERPVVLLRGDMDGLPVTEEVDVDYASEHVGAMHACGHDLHVAALVGAARILHAQREQLAGDVVLMFQPAEEGPGGAEPMLAEGLLDVAGRRVDAAYALHVFSSEIPRGRWESRPRELMAGADTVDITVTGAGGHGSAPHRALDPVPVLCEVVLALQTMVTRTFDVFDPVVLTVGRVSAGTKDNIIGDTAELSATLRTFSTAHRELAHRSIERVAAGVSAAHGMTCTVGFSEGYPATVNDVAELEHGRQVVLDLFGPESYRERERPEMGSEDMSFVMAEVPGAYLFLGACPEGVDPQDAPDNHSPRAAFDDAVVPDGAAWLAEVALQRCRSL
ncbi:M20 metallopeptidase family protein [Ornithinimicrobium sediminis]|uniref:M20 metallopeptidase family protein n=1 Tax=Ornithinimicrobium sediminis TaxID=2904603 RepID=UPI001E2A4B25|nr:M20 family metallopeptidase [Ornithinimicrobium sediminis]MCE0487195.1 M20 family metallopeptidase [Ornithinimicrobium sediminis]